MFNLGKFMKKILILFITVIILTGCNYNLQERTENNIITDMTKYHFNYKGHQYIMFAPYSALQHNAIVHDPDCPCLKQ